jgi:esterase/lipase superfamily enzyme
MRAAQIAYDLGFQGVPMYYSWPSTSTTALYTHDENEVRWAESSYRAFVELCRTRLGLSKLHVVAHSMGSRLVAETLAQVGEAGDGAPLHTVVFAAPDIDAETFGDLAREFRGRAGSCTLYASSKDYALHASAAVHGYRRAGDSRDGVLIAPGVDSIHAEAVDTGLLGHSYIGDSRSILSDVYYLLRGLRPASRAFLREVITDTGSYWVLGP